MKFFQRIYDYCIELSAHPRAMFFMAANSFIESIFWPLPVDAMLIPMCLARPKKSFRIAFVAVLFSVLGAVVGYLMGYYLWDVLVRDIFESLNLMRHVDVIEKWFHEFGILFVAVGAFTPVPYKVIAVTTGMMASSAMVGFWDITSQLSLPLFILVSVLGRGARFYLEAGVIRLGGKPMAEKIRRYIDILGWLTLAAVAVAILIYKLRS